VVAAMLTLPSVMRASAFMRVVSVSMSCMCCSTHTEHTQTSHTGGQAQKVHKEASAVAKTDAKQMHNSPTASPSSCQRAQTAAATCRPQACQLQ
jgi:hypothetical protein